MPCWSKSLLVFICKECVHLYYCCTTSLHLHKLTGVNRTPHIIWPHLYTYLAKHALKARFTWCLSIKFGWTVWNIPLNRCTRCVYNCMCIQFPYVKKKTYSIRAVYSIFFFFFYTWCKPSFIPVQKVHINYKLFIMSEEFQMFWGIENFSSDPEQV